MTRKLMWVEAKGMKYVGVHDNDAQCEGCVFDDGHPLEAHCGIIPCRTDDVYGHRSLIYVPLEPQHIPNLRAKGRKIK
jgi:hypothetical protein